MAINMGIIKQISRTYTNVHNNKPAQFVAVVCHQSDHI
jgi:hypothetical protein